ncbi:hypothetical protein [Mycobacterium sp.]|uniref:hypothetical protein n=1 Tax=Mycobacterium sp. TaxID=1785 RepID=UPI00338F070A
MVNLCDSPPMPTVSLPARTAARAWYSPLTGTARLFLRARSRLDQQISAKTMSSRGKMLTNSPLAARYRTSITEIGTNCATASTRLEKLDVPALADQVTVADVIIASVSFITS